MLSIDQIKTKAQSWLGSEFNDETRKEVKEMLANDEKKLIDAFYQDLEFGTGGLRGIMGAGTNRMNIYTLGMATQGLSNYIIKQCGSSGIRVAIAHDCRNNSRYFAETTANIFSANGFEVYLFESLRPTPELSYAIRHYKCQSGVVITASHNPPEYNGYKAYWDDGGQVVAPHDDGITDEVRKITSVNDIKFNGNKEKKKYKGNEFIIKTIVTSDLIEKIAEGFNVEYFNVLTGFKFFAELIRENEGTKKYIGGGEESYGFLPGDYVRDKDAVASCALVAEATAWAISKGMSLYDLL